MRTDFGDLFVEQAMVHVVPKRARNEDLRPLELSQTFCRLADDVRSELQTKLRDVFANLGREVIEDPELKSSLPDAVRAFLHNGQDLVQVSGDLAYALRDSQGGKSPAGLLLVAAARLGSHRALLVVKLEHETGMQANEITTEGLRTFDMQYYANLLLTQKSKVYKVALFSEEGLAETELQGWAADPQQAGKTVARFFLEKFLGCRHQNDPRELTRRFHDITMNWINSRLTDSDERVECVMATMVELQSSTPELDPAEFIQTHVKEAHQADLIAYLAENDVPIRTFEKNTQLVSNRLQKMRVDLANGAFLVAPLEAMQDGTIQVEDLGDGRTTVTVTSVLDKTSSGAAAGPTPKKTVPHPAPPSQTETLPGFETFHRVLPVQPKSSQNGHALPPAQA
ncbi:nucleoid-associated protein [Streptomyces sp. NPDC052179]|uniref:nucleoid-associated protein n=1 Tax=Streptomyces sp. NPDC052179 TaxID=3155680 RepID=UPI00344ACB54